MGTIDNVFCYDIDDLGAVVEDGQRQFGFDFNPLFPQAMQQRVLVNLFDVAVAMVAVNRKTCLSNHVTQSEDSVSVRDGGFHRFFFLCFLCLFAAKKTAHFFGASLARNLL